MYSAEISEKKVDVVLIIFLNTARTHITIGHVRGERFVLSLSEEEEFPVNGRHRGVYGIRDE